MNLPSMITFVAKIFISGVLFPAAMGVLRSFIVFTSELLCLEPRHRFSRITLSVFYNKIGPYVQNIRRTQTARIKNKIHFLITYFLTASKIDILLFLPMVLFYTMNMSTALYNNTAKEQLLFSFTAIAIYCIVSILINIYTRLLFSLEPIVKQILDRVTTSKLKHLLNPLLFIVIAMIFFIRSFFIKERPGFVYALGILSYVVIFSEMYHPGYVFIAFIFIGIQMLNLDLYGSLISDILENSSESAFALSYMLFLTNAQKSPYTIIKRTAFRSAAGIFFGKTGLTPTGKASIVVGAMGAGAIFINGELERRHRAYQNELARAHTSSENEKQRAHDSSEAEKKRAHERERWARDDAQKRSSWWSKK